MSSAPDLRALLSGDPVPAPPFETDPMTEHYEDTDEQRERVLKNRQVLGFVAGFWTRRPWLLTATVTFTLVAIAFDLMVPWASGRLVDAVTAGPAHVDPAWKAWAVFVGVYLAFTVIRNLAVRFLIPLSANNMKDMTDEAFKRVQSFSADWHADNFAGATVRRLSRAMWGYDVVTDAALMWFGPAGIVLAGPMAGFFRRTFCPTTRRSCRGSRARE